MRAYDRKLKPYLAMGPARPPPWGRGPGRQTVSDLGPAVRQGQSGIGKAYPSQIGSKFGYSDHRFGYSDGGSGDPPPFFVFMYQGVLLKDSWSPRQST